MGERKGQNFYYPPDFDYKKHKTLNQYHGAHALRERAAKIKQGILIIRFEMPFNVWCMGCHNHVGMGVRYNAEKKKVGMYYTTPIYEFRMKCHLCDNYFVIRTDPEHFDYEMVEGLHRQEKRYDPSTIDQLGAVDRGLSSLLEGDKMFKVEHEEQDEKKSVDVEKQIDKLEWVQERMRDDFAANQFLRGAFRREKTDLNEQRVKDANLLKGMSLNIKLASESVQDKKLAAMVLRYRSIDNSEKEQELRRAALMERSIFSKRKTPPEDRVRATSTGKEILVSNLQRLSNVGFDTLPSTSPQLKSDSIGVIVKKAKQETANTEVFSQKQVKEEFSDGLKLTNMDRLLQHEKSSDGHQKMEKGGRRESIPLNSSLSLVASYGSGSSTDSDEHG